jgi:hypothetical protein
MSTVHFLRWLLHTHLSVEMRNSHWGFAIVEMAHLLGLAGLGGAVLIVDLRLLGVVLRRQPVARVAEDLWPILIGSLAVMVASGTLLATAFPLKYYYSPAFRLKMLILALAVSFYFTLHLRVVTSDPDRLSAWSKLAAVVSLLLWLGVGVAGRAIGFY